MRHDSRRHGFTPMPNADRVAGRNAPGTMAFMPGRADLTVLYIHIPKAAGTTLNAIIQSNYHGSETFVVTRPREQSIAAFGSLPAERRAQFRLITGHHFAFGLHRLVPGRWTYVTMLREPIERVISHYHYVTRTPQHRHYQLVSGSGMGLRDYLTSGLERRLDNGQVRMIAGADEVAFGACTDATLRQAKRNLDEAFAVAGLTERFDESVLLMCRALGWRPALYAKQNVAQGKPAQSDVPADVMQTIVDLNRLDTELYAHASQKFNELVTRQGPAFDQELAAFQAGNAQFAQQRGAGRA